MPVLCVRTERDGLLSAIAPIGLAAAVETALVVDLDPEGPGYRGETSLARLVADGPTRRDLHPSRGGVAVLRNGGIAYQDAEQILDALSEGWPHLVLRLPTRGLSVRYAPVVPIVPLLPGALAVAQKSPAVFQRAGFRLKPPAPGPVLPRPSQRTVGGLLRGQIDSHSRWIRAWRGVWELPWM
ncbi:MAG: hypothetical protein GWP04_05475 [Gammaproteobacteria bacterium]|nr:hypothetical protein [Gammaproteobacteria bacterium]